jgi:hypothetical protein
MLGRLLFPSTFCNTPAPTSVVSPTLTVLCAVPCVLCLQEEQLFHNLSAVLQRMRVAASVSEARELALQLRRMCAAVRASLETHVR